MYDPIELSKKTENIVTNGNLKKYYRFRPTGFYGGIATADTVGCNLRCKFCWSGNSVWNSKNTGKFYSSEQVANQLQIIAQQKGYRQLRVSGGEPTIGREHLIKLLKNIELPHHRHRQHAAEHQLHLPGRAGQAERDDDVQGERHG